MIPPIALFGVPFRVNPWFFALLAAAALLGKLGHVAVLFFILLPHELAHLAVARMEGLRVNGVELMPFGGAADIDGMLERGPMAEARVAFAGPLSNIFLAGLASLAMRTPFFSAELLGFYLDWNLTMGLFNLLPVLPLDGGRVMRSILSLRYSFREATDRSLRLGRLIAWTMLSIALVGLVRGSHSPLLLFLSPFLILALRREGAENSYKVLLRAVTRKEAMYRRGAMEVKTLAVVEDYPARSVLLQAVPGRYHLILVLDDQARFIGQVGEVEFLEALIDTSPSATVREVWESIFRG